MITQHPVTYLADLLIKSEEQAEIDPAKAYQLVTVKLWGKGVELRGEFEGIGLTNSKLFVVKERQFILSKIDARNGAFGLIPSSLDGAVVSSDFPTFSLNTSKILPEYLNWLSKTNDFISICAGASEGSTNRVRLKIERFLATQIPLPPLEEQRRIVARIEELAGKIEEARGLQRDALENANKLWNASLETTFKSLSAKYPKIEFQDFCEVVRGGSPRPAGDPAYYDGPIPFLKVADLTKDDSKFVTKHSATIKEAGLNRSRFVKSGTLMLTNSGATLGVPKICTFDTCFNDGIQAFLNVEPNISLEYLYYFLQFKTRWFREWIARGQGQPNLNTEMVKTLNVPLPPPTEQAKAIQHLDSTYNQINKLKQKQAVSTAELNALLPSNSRQSIQGGAIT